MLREEERFCSVTTADEESDPELARLELERVEPAVTSQREIGMPPSRNGRARLHLVHPFDAQVVPMSMLPS